MPIGHAARIRVAGRRAVTKPVGHPFWRQRSGSLIPAKPRPKAAFVSRDREAIWSEHIICPLGHQKSALTALFRYRKEDAYKTLI